jgi:pimeloyl-ACP methyl ester carboxylesterase
VEHQFVEIPDLRVHVAQAGHGEPVLLLHGFGQHWWEWRDVLPALMDRYCVICPDLRGAGWTDAPAVGYTREQQMADAVALLMVDRAGHYLVDERADAVVDVARQLFARP